MILSTRKFALRFLAVCAIAVVAAAAARSHSDFAKMRDAYQRGNHREFVKHVAAFAESDPLKFVGNYWTAAWDLRRGRPAAAEEFWRQSDSAYFADRARRDLLAHYAARTEWKNYARLRDAAADSPTNSCAESRYRLHSGKAAATEIRDAFFAAQSANGLCRTVFREAKKAGFLSEDNIWQKIRDAAAARKMRLVREIVLTFPNRVSYRRVRNVVRNAVRYIKAKHGLQNRAARELVMISAMVAARRRPQLAAARWIKFSPYFQPNENAEVWAAIGEWGARRHLRQASGWLAKAGESRTENSRAWRTRAAIRTGDWSAVAAAVQAMPPAEKAVTAWRYWLGRAQMELGDKNSATEEWRRLALADDFYGLLAREELGLPLASPTDSDSVILPVSSSQKSVPADVLIALSLRQAGAKKMARDVWKFAVAQMDDESRIAAANLAMREGWILASINAADAAGKEGDRLRFPTPYAKLIGRYAAQLNLDKSFVYGLIRQESRFMPKAISSANARGLMQVLPSTARIVARRHKFGRYKKSRLIRPDTNIIIGTHYLAGLAERFDGDLVLMAAGYNAGPGRAKRWLGGKGKGGIPARDMLAYVETIPLTETRLYVKHLLANRVHYENIFGRSPLSLKALIGE